MNLSDELSLSYYRTVAYINETQTIELVQHTETGKFYVKKHLNVYNADVYQSLKQQPIPNTPVIYELAEDESGLTVIEEYLAGDTLQEILDRDGNLSEDEVISFLLELCPIISDLHHRNPPIIHRDIKPSNIIISPDGVLKLLDFNAAKYMLSDQSRDTRLLGTTGYAAPEQYGFGASAVQTDLYAMGVLMNVLLCGDIPTEHAAEGRLAGIIKKCTELNPADRFQSVDDLEKALKEMNPKSHSREGASWRRFLPPGFRTGSVFHMFIAIPVYLFIFLLGAGLQTEASSPADLLLNRIAVTVLMLLIVFFTADYLGIQEKLPLTNSKNAAVHWLGIILYDVLLMFIVIMALLLMEELFF